MLRRLASAALITAIVPALALAQARPAPQPRPAAPPQRRPATPANRSPAPAPAATAHREGSVELTVGVGGLYASKFYGDGTSGAAGFMGLAGLGYNINRHLGIGVGAGAGSISGAGGGPSKTFIQPLGSLTYTADLDRTTSPFVTLGANLTRVSYSGIHSTSRYGAHVGVGLRHFIQDNLAVRLEVRGVMDNWSQGVGPTAQAQGLIGLSYFIGGGPPPDADGDGVPDRRDACPGTPRGATVDARGCPHDSDHDGVYDGIDRCANTPPDTQVDQYGCTLDTDHDGIPDNLDRCPGTPAGTAVDANGCPRDSDNDGVPDNLDRCPNTPRGVPVEAAGDRAGCPRDSDGDGVPDYQDRCPGTPPNTPVDANGCPRDSDGDGVPDGVDRCPNTPPGTPVNATGCPVQRDSDGDGVPDSLDHCPDTPRGARVDRAGCPLAELPQAVGAALVLRNVTFASGSSRLLPGDNTILDPVAAAILAAPGSKWEIGGYTDNRGSAAANTRLSAARARAVVQYLVGKGVPAAALTAVGYGPRNPADPNTTPAGRLANRRVEIKRLQ